MKTHARRPVAWLVALLLLPLGSAASAQVGEDPFVFDGAREFEHDEDAGNFINFIDYEIQRILALDLYGVTAQLPQGWLKIKWDWGLIEAGARYDEFGNRGPVIDPLQFDVNGDLLISAGLDLTGQGAGHTIQMSYGVIDNLDWYIEHTWFRQDIEVSAEMQEVDDEGNRISPSIAGLVGVDDPTTYDSEQFLYDTFPRLGRPALDSEFHGRRLLGDINTGFSYNYFRNSRMSASITPRIFIPTGWTPDPNNNILYGTGPALEVNGGGWAVSATQGYDFRLFRYGGWFDLVLSSETTVGYAFKQNREYPTNFVEPDDVAAQLDPATFPDLSGLEGTFEYTPGWSLDWLVQLSAQFGPVGLSAGYGVTHSQAPIVDGDEGWLSMIDSLQLIGSATTYAVEVGGALSLLPIYVPMNIGISYREAVGGQNAIVFDNWWTIRAELFAPLHYIWNPRPWEENGPIEGDEG